MDPVPSAVSRGPLRRVGPMVKALRPKQWVKNGLLFAATVFSFHFDSWSCWLQALVGFVAFCLISSAGYILNDIRDRDADRRHPTKCHRPIASGSLPMGLAHVEMISVGILGLLVSASLGLPFLTVSLLYLATTLSYSQFFKHAVILDVMMLSAGFIWRAVAGAVAIGVSISPWFILCTAFLALFLGFNKRKGELRLMEGRGEGTRRILSEYSLGMLQEFQGITTSGAVISYALYTVLASPSRWLLLTLPYVVYGIFRYIYLVEQRGEGGAPDETLFRDKPLLVTCVLYTLTTVALLLLSRVQAA